MNLGCKQALTEIWLQSDCFFNWDWKPRSAFLGSYKWNLNEIILVLHIHVYYNKMFHFWVSDFTENHSKRETFHLWEIKIVYRRQTNELLNKRFKKGSQTVKIL